jgi:hypothetical protein
MPIAPAAQTDRAGHQIKSLRVGVGGGRGKGAVGDALSQLDVVQIHQGQPPPFRHSDSLVDLLRGAHEEPAREDGEGRDEEGEPPGPVRPQLFFGEMSTLGSIGK